MEEVINLISQIAPDAMSVLLRRISILKIVQEEGPIGRRKISNILCISERTIRNDIVFLLDQHYIEVNSKGIVLTYEGSILIEDSSDLISTISRTDDLATRIQERLSLDKVIVARIDVEKNSHGYDKLGKIGANVIKDYIKEKNIIAITGGTTIKKVVDNFCNYIESRNIMVLPARGGVGKDIEIECNTIVSKFASKINANYKLLHVPAYMSNDTLKSLIKERDIKEIMTLLEKTDMIIFGIGTAKQAAEKRGVSSQVLNEIVANGAEGEAFGCYFDYNGNVVCKTPTIGINEKNISNIDNIIAVAAGAFKARAIIATMSYIGKGVLITDEVTAIEILSELDN